MSDRNIYQRKYIFSGHILEQFTYENNQFRGFGPKNKKGKNRAGISPELNRANVLSRNKKNIIRLINSNPDMNKFLTLTYDDNVEDLDKSNLDFKNFIKRVNYSVFGTKKSKLKYLAVIEFQDRGAIHYHVVCNLPFVDFNDLSKLWGHGFIFINRIKNSNNDDISIDCDNIGAYISKYMTKDNDDPRLKERKSYLFSRNLERPSEFIVNCDEVDYIEKQYNLPEPVNAYFSNKADYSYSYSSEYSGSVIVNQYNLKRRFNNKDVHLY